MRSFSGYLAKCPQPWHLRRMRVLRIGVAMLRTVERRRPQLYAYRMQVHHLCLPPSLNRHQRRHRHQSLHRNLRRQQLPCHLRPRVRRRLCIRLLSNPILHHRAHSQTNSQPRQHLHPYSHPHVRPSSHPKPHPRPCLLHALRQLGVKQWYMPLRLRYLRKRPWRCSRHQKWFPNHLCRRAHQHLHPPLHQGQCH